MSNFTVRNKCCFCEQTIFDVLFENDRTIPISYNMIDTRIDDSISIPFNVIKCLNCKTYQNKYLGNLNLVYGRHVNPVGKIHQNMKECYCNFICFNKNINGFIEIGAGNGDLSEKLLNINKVPYYIIDPFYCGNTTDRIIISSFLEDTPLTNFSANTIVTSHLFEHLYCPLQFITTAIKNQIKYIYICIPDFENSIKKESFCNTLNIEHTFYIENKFIEEIFKKYGYTCNRRYEYFNHSIMFEFEYNGLPILLLNPVNQTSENDIPNYINTLIERTMSINKMIDDHYGIYKIYLWPSSAHSLYLCYYGLNYFKIDYLLDNSPDKINKYFYGYNLKCISMNDIINTNDKSLLILHGGCFNTEIKITNPNIKVISF